MIVVLAVVMFLVLGLLIFRFSLPKSLVSAKITPSVSSEDIEIRLDQLEKAVAKMISQTPLISPTGTSSDTKTQTSPNLEARLNNLESSLASLQASVNSLKGTTDATTDSTSVAKKSPVYIPLGWQGSASSTDWTSVAAQSFTFDPADYPGFTNVTFEANLQIYQGNGTAYARLYNNTDSGAVYGSDLSTTSQDYKWVSSSSFALTNAKKTYILQLRSNTAYASMVQNARLKISF